MNEQAIEHRTDDAEGRLDFIKAWRTIQGEGPRVGEPAVFIRLAGCNLNCPACDTNYTAGRKLLSVETIWKEHVVKALEQGNWSQTTPLIVITGGEPFRQNIVPLVDFLAMRRLRIQIETNGLDYRMDFPWRKAQIICSPKASKIHEGLQPHLAALKYVLQAGHIDTTDGLPTSTLGRPNRVARPEDWCPAEIFVQPLDQGNVELNRANIAATLEVVHKFGYRLSLQVHKIVGVE